jgi:hypothetical protein
MEQVEGSLKEMEKMVKAAGERGRQLETLSTIETKAAMDSVENGKKFVEPRETR